LLKSERYRCCRYTSRGRNGGPATAFVLAATATATGVASTVQVMKCPRGMSCLMAALNYAAVAAVVVEAPDIAATFTTAKGAH
jgi:hypothetical protein